MFLSSFCHVISLSPPFGPPKFYYNSRGHPFTISESCPPALSMLVWVKFHRISFCCFVMLLPLFFLHEICFDFSGRGHPHSTFERSFPLYHTLLFIFVSLKFRRLWSCCKIMSLPLFRPLSTLFLLQWQGHSLLQILKDLPRPSARYYWQSFSEISLYFIMMLAPSFRLLLLNFHVIVMTILRPASFQSRKYAYALISSELLLKLWSRVKL